MIRTVDVIEALRDRWTRTPGDTRVAVLAVAAASPIVVAAVLVFTGTPDNGSTPFSPRTAYPTGTVPTASAPATTLDPAEGAPAALHGGLSSPTTVTAPRMAPRIHVPLVPRPTVPGETGSTDANTRTPSGPLSATESASPPVPDPTVSPEPSETNSGPIPSTSADPGPQLLPEAP